MHPIIFHNIHIFEEKNVNQVLFTRTITETDRSWNEAENQGFIKVSQDAKILLI